MNTLIIAMIWVLNFAISGWNAYACGRVWIEAKAAGGWPRFMTWMGAIMSASGFSWCYLILLVLFAHFNGVYWPVEHDGVKEWVVYQLPLREATVALQLGYLLIVPAVLFSGLMITVDSWARAWRERTLLNFGSASYNTFAQAYNTYHAISGMGEAFASVGQYFFKSDSKSDSKNGAGLLLLLLVAIALLAGVLTTTVIICTVAGRESIRIPRSREEHRRIYGREAVPA